MHQKSIDTDRVYAISVRTIAEAAADFGWYAVISRIKYLLVDFYSLNSHVLNENRILH